MQPDPGKKHELSSRISIDTLKKYFFINYISNKLKEFLSNRVVMFTLKKPIPQVVKLEGKYKITLPAGQTIEIEEKTFNDNFKPISPDDKVMEIKRKLIAIKDLHSELDDDNAESLLLDAIDKASEIMNLL